MNPLPPGSTIGILGGGQLGRMLAIAAAQLGFDVHIFTDEPDSPASRVAAKTAIGSIKITRRWRISRAMFMSSRLNSKTYRRKLLKR